jgi:glycosyltransferase involved in cell wall biosynthesis
VFPENFGPNQGYPIEVVNALYNASDLIVSTTLGEGWGMSWCESMAAGTPVLMPRNTVMEEIITEEKGYLCDSGTTPALHTVLPHDNEVIRPLVDIDDMVNKLIHIYNNYDEAKAKADKAYDWIRSDLNWQGNIGEQWVKVFDKVTLSLLTDTTSETGSVIDTESF